MKLKIFFLLFINLFHFNKSYHPKFFQINFNPYSNWFSSEPEPKPLYLTPYIEHGDIETAQYLSFVTHPQMENIESYAGYLTVNKEYNSNMFFWYFPAEIESTAAPTILWLAGGFGGSGLFSAFAETGPIEITQKGKLIRRKYTWQKMANIIYIDNPIGAGYSFTDHERGYSRDDKDVGLNLLIALRQFFRLFPEIQSNDFYISGESYGGKHTIALGHFILQNQHLEPRINLKGLSLGDGLFDPVNLFHYGSYLYELGLVDRAGKMIFEALEIQGRTCVLNENYLCAYQIMQNLIKVNPFDPPNISIYQNLTGLTSYTNYAKIGPDDFTAVEQFVKKKSFRQAIHVGRKMFHGIFNSAVVAKHIEGSFFRSVKDWLEELLSFYRVYLYNGQFDVAIAYPLTEKAVETMKFSGSEYYFNTSRKFWYVDGELAGQTKHVGNLTTILVRDAGHMAMIDQPKWVYNIIQKMISNTPF